MTQPAERRLIVIDTMRALDFEEIQKINDVIIPRWRLRDTGNQVSIIEQREIVQILAKARGVTETWIIANNLLDIVVKTYSEAGWNVLREQPDDNTPSDATFYFSRKGR